MTGTSEPPTIECRGLTRRFGGVQAVQNVTVSFDAGKVCALLGPNGAGKTTLFHLISGAVPPDRGDILLRGAPITGLPTWKIARRGVGRLFQDVRVFGSMTVLDNVCVAVPGQAGENPFTALVRPAYVGRQTRDVREHAMSVLARVGLEDKADAKADTLSFGQQKLAALARLLAFDFDVLLLDEPTAGVQPRTVRVLLRLLRELASEGKTVVVIEHDMNTVMEVADWVWFMDSGQVRAFGLPADVLGDPFVRERYLGL